jgi:hypothetical protein
MILDRFGSGNSLDDRLGEKSECMVSTNLLAIAILIDIFTCFACDIDGVRQEFKGEIISIADYWNQDPGTTKMSGINSTNEIESTHRIREETRAAVDRYRDEHPARPSASSSGTLASASEEPSNGRLAEAGLIGAASGSGKAAKAHIIGNGGEGIDVPNKHGLLSPQLKSERKQMLKVFQSLWKRG